MNSSKLVSGILQWEVQNLGSQFQNYSGSDCAACEYFSGCWPCSWWGYRNLTANIPQTLTSASTKLAAGGGNQSKWHFNLVFNSRSLEIYLIFDGLFKSDGSKMDEPLTFDYQAVVEKSVMGRTEIMCSPYGSESSTNKSFLIKAISFQEFDSSRSDGSLKISVEISHLSDFVNQVVNNGKFIHSTDLTDSLSSCYENLMNNPDLADFTIICEESTFHAHKFILSVRSPVFRAMLESGMLESTQNKLELKDMAVETLKLMLEYIYTGTIQNFPEDLKVKIELLDSAEKYELKGLKSICMSKLFSNPLTERTFDIGQLAMAASIYGANFGTQKVIKDYCMKNHAKLMENPEYKKLFLANPQMFIN